MLDDGSPRVPQAIFDSGLPILGICYGQQVMMHQLGGAVQAGDSGEFGRAFIEIGDACALFDGLWAERESHQVWMSHGDKVTALAPGFRPVAASPGAPFAVIADDTRRYYAMQFHPEVVHTPDGGRLLVADIRNHRLRAIDLATNTVHTIAGNGKPGRPIDGAAATATPLAGPRAACEAADGTVYLVLREGNALVAIRDGRVETVVNASGKAGYGGDDGPGREAALKGPKYVCMDREQRVLIVDTENHCIRRYDPATGRIDLVAGVPQRANAAIGGDWKSTELRRPHGVRIAPDGRLVIADSDNDRLLIGAYTTKPMASSRGTTSIPSANRYGRTVGETTSK